MKKRSIVCLMVAALIGSSVVIPANNIQEETITVSAAVYDTVPEGYTGIYTINDLYAVRNNLSGKYILMNDIDMSETAPGGDWDNGNGWKPIGSSGENAFTGIFDGNGYAIKNMHIFGTTGGYLGLFGKCGGVIKRVALVDCDIDIDVPSNSDVCVGSISGGTSGYYHFLLQYCYATGSIKVSINCAEYNDTYEEYYIGGIAGDTSISNSFNNCDIFISVVNDNSQEHSDYKNYFNVGGVTGYDGHILRGGSSYSSGQYLYNTGKIEIKKDSGIGEYVIGNIFADGFGCFSNSYYLKNSSDYSAISSYDDSSLSNVSALTAGQMKSSSAFTGFDFSDVWTIDSNAEYPYPTFINVPYVSTQSSIVEPTQPTTNPSISTGTKKGDMNGDGLVDAVDASLILSYYAYLSTGGTITDFDMWFNK